jgi:hypothetical protein
MPSVWNRSLKECITDKWLLGAVLSIAAFVNFVHLSDFWLSIDEELASFASHSWMGWIAQGRWGMGLINAILPDYAPVPFISTFIFVVGISLSAILFAKVVTDDRLEIFVFSGILVVSPIWLQVAEFNTLAAGLGIGLLVVSIAMQCIRVGSFFYTLCAGLCVGFALGIYQALIVVYAIGCVVLIFPFDYFWSERRSAGSVVTPALIYRVLGSVFIGGVFYFVMQRSLLIITHQHSVYIDIYVQLSELEDHFTVTVARIFGQLGGILLGTDSIYLDWGRMLVVLPLVGFCYGVFKVAGLVRFGAMRSISSCFSVLAVIVCCSGLIVLAAGRMPVRALIGFPFLFALLSLNAYRMSARLVRWPYWAVFAYTVLISGWIGASLFYADRVARVRDQVLATHLISAIYLVAQPTASVRIPFVVVGERTFSDDGVARHVQVFGQSFFDQDGGNPYRIAAYLRFLGVEGLVPLPITTLRRNMRELRGMPTWPAPGAVAMIDNTLVVKLGDISYQQRLLLGQDLR